MISLRSNPARAGIASALTLLALCAAMLALPVVGTAAPAEEPPAPQLSFEPGSYDFGLQQVNSSASQATLQLRNTGVAAAPVYSLEISGPGSNAFWIGQSDCYGRTLNPSETCSVQVNFNPYDAVELSAQLRAGSEGSTIFTADLSGEGGRAQLDVDTNPTNFGSVAVGSAGVIKTIDITNNGNYPGGSFIAVIAGGAVGSFHLLDENCTGIPLSPGATCNVVVSFQPLSSGAKTARLGLFGDSDGGAQITLTGVGVDPESKTAVASGPAAVSGVPAAQPRRRRHQRLRPSRGQSLHGHGRHRRINPSRVSA